MFYWYLVSDGSNSAVTTLQLDCQDLQDYLSHHSSEVCRNEIIDFSDISSTESESHDDISVGYIRFTALVTALHKPVIVGFMSPMVVSYICTYVHP